MLECIEMIIKILRIKKAAWRRPKWLDKVDDLTLLNAQLVSQARDMCYATK